MNNDDSLNRQQLQQLAKELRKMHKLLIDLQSASFGPVGNPFEHLQLVTMHPDFAWLRVLSEFMVELDQRLDEKDAIDDAASSAFKDALERLIGPAEPGQPEFRQKYLAGLQASPETTMQHAALRLALGQLKRTTQP
ncbi:hypothetical protein PQR62_02175 [Herbaspirillum lusitanum]|jgi:hypothetical protein|uniref:Uncharacterized protein n=1 Tax=Herbaspirillum lusitanum TaxID=213312 RepID=A0ABW9A3P0_9BURK